jgi:RimJ/RimL family protein N-acetyltransferase
MGEQVQDRIPEDFRRVRSVFEGALVRLRAVEEDDLARLNRLIWDPDVTRTLGLVWPEPVAGTRAWWERIRKDADSSAFAIETIPGELIGGCGLHEIDASARSAILGIWIAGSHWGRGYGTDAVRCLCRFGFREMNLQRIGLSVFEGNDRGRKAYEKVGFVVEGRRRRDKLIGGRLVDVYEMGLLVDDFADPGA